MKEYLLDINNVLKDLKTSVYGLSEEEARDRICAYGKNKLKEPPKEGWFKKFIKSLADPMIIMLLAAAIISGITAAIEGENFTDVFIILLVVLINTILGMIQESKAEHAINALMEMTKASSKVIRNGMLKIINSEELTVGDIIVLESGDTIPADCRVLESYNMKVEEAAITGESIPVNKITDILYLKKNTLDIPLGDRTNMLYNGSSVVYGRGKAVVIAIGMNTEMGKIANALQNEKKEQTPLQKKMTELSKFLTKIVIGISLFVLILGILRTGDFSGVNILNTFLVAVALAVAAIPEGLPTVVTIILSLGVTAMAKRHCLIRKLSAVETLGCTQVICSDKTGTLTENKMTVTDIYTSDPILLSEAIVLCSNVEIKPGENIAIGDPTEVALVNYAQKLEISKYDLENRFPRIGEVPFDSNRKLMSTIHKNKAGKIVQYTKGACEILLEKCTSYIDDNGYISPMTEDYKEKIKSNAKIYADKALRILAAAYKVYNNTPNSFDSDEIENNLIFIGFLGMIDPCRPEVYESIQECKNAGIRTIMITGDHVDTAIAIGKQLNLVKDKTETITGNDIDKLSDEELIHVVKTISVFARVKPEHKTRIVKALKAQNLVVAMTGDGVNDAPSIKSADIGISMGITGTDVTKGASDMVLADDNFATIVNAVEEGRKVYDNIRKVLQFQLSTNMAEVLYVFISSVLGITIVSPAQLLWINMVTDTSPGLALGMEKAEENLMNRKPRSSNESIFSKGAGLDMIIHGSIMAVIVIFSFFLGQYIELGHFGIFDSRDGMTMAFLTANFIEMFHAISMRSLRNSIFKINSHNKWLVYAFILTTILTLGVIYIPFLANVFEFSNINLKEFLISFGLAFLIVPIIEVIKFLHRNSKKYKESNI